LNPRDYPAFFAAQTVLSASRLVPEIRLHLATELTPLWQATETFLQIQNIAPPYWAFAWPGAEALARYVTDRPALARARRVLDFAAGCGLAGIACARAGAAAVTAAELDPLACAAIDLNAAANGVTIESLQGDIVGQPCRWDLIVCGDVFYEAPMSRHILPWLRRLAADALVIAADPGRAYVPREGIEALARITVPTTRELEDRDSREVTLFKILASA
jgi:predicted nicotinamide N-methyase